jgi:hypothetical protein
MKKETSSFLLQLLIAEGRIWLDEEDYVGKAADGVIVSLGVLGGEKQLSEYLSTHPDPEDW